jgi:hypothetical protein
VAGSRGAETSYKKLAADKDYVNVVDGVLQPLQWLKSMPSARGPEMQVVQSKLRQALAAQKPSMYRNFAFNQTAMGAGMFTEADIAWYDTFYKMIGTDESLHAAMLAVYKWSGPGARALATTLPQSFLPLVPQSYQVPLWSNFYFNTNCVISMCWLCTMCWVAVAPFKFAVLCKGGFVGYRLQVVGCSNPLSCPSTIWF